MTHVRSRSSVLSFQFSVFSFLFLFALLTAAHAFAQAPSASITGAVLDPLGGPVGGATITLWRDGAQVANTTSDVEGRYKLAGVATGRHQIEVQAAGFMPRTVGVPFVGTSGNVRVDVSLQIGLAQEVLVTASANETPASQAGSSATVIDRAMLDTLGKSDVLEALRLVPGAAIVQLGARGGPASLFVRGGASNFSKVLIDGVPANDIGGAFDFSNLTTTGLDRIEVLRNANSVLYGSDALAGVVSLTTRRGRTRVPETALALDGGNFGTGRQAASIGGAVDRFDYFFDASHFETDNQVANSAYRNNTVAGRFGWAFNGSTSAGVTVRHVGSGAGSPNATGVYGVADDSAQESGATHVALEVQSQINSRWRTAARVASMDQDYTFINPKPTGQASDPFGFGSPNYLGSVVTLKGANGYSVTGQGILDYDPYPGTYPTNYHAETTRRMAYGHVTGEIASGLEVTGGARVEREAGFTKYGLSPESRTERTNGGLFAEARITRRRLFVSAGIGYDHNAIFESAVTPRVSVAAYLRDPSATARVSDTKVIFNAGRGIKAPSISQELSSLFTVVDALATKPAGTAGLSPIGPERSRSVDAGVDQGLWGGRARARLTYFDNRFSDLIEYVSASAMTARLGIPATVAAASGFGAYVNSSTYTARGVELSGEMTIGPYARVVVSYTHLDAKVEKSFASGALFPSTNPKFPSIPIGQFGPLVGAAPFRRPANSGNFLLAVEKGLVHVAVAGYLAGKSDDSTYAFDAFFGNSMLLPNRDLNAAYQKIDLSASYRIRQEIRWYLSVENLFDRSYHAAFGYPALSRSARMGVAISLGGDRRRP